MKHVWTWLALFSGLLEASHSSLAHSHARRSLDHRRRMHVSFWSRDDITDSIVNDVNQLLSLAGDSSTSTYSSTLTDTSTSTSSDTIAFTSTDTATTTTPSDPGNTQSNTDTTTTMVSDPGTTATTTTSGSGSDPSNIGTDSGSNSATTTSADNTQPTLTVTDSSSSSDSNTATTTGAPGPISQSTTDTGTSTTSGNLVNTVASDLSSVLGGSTTNPPQPTPTDTQSSAQDTTQTQSDTQSTPPPPPPTTTASDILPSATSSVGNVVTSIADTGSSTSLPNAPTTTASTSDHGPTQTQPTGPTTSLPDGPTTTPITSDYGPTQTQPTGPTTSLPDGPTTTASTSDYGPTQTQTTGPTTTPPPESNTQTNSDQLTGGTTATPPPQSNTQTSSDQQTGGTTATPPPESITRSNSDQQTGTTTATVSMPVNTQSTATVFFPTVTATNSLDAASMSSVLASIDSESGMLKPTATITTDSAGQSFTYESVSTSLPSQYSFITATGLAFTSVTSASATLTNPDQVVTTLTLTDTGTAAPTQSVAMSSTIPTRIFDSTNPVNPSDDPGFTLVAIKLMPTLNWPDVASNMQNAAIVFAYFPQAISFALAIPDDQVKIYCLQAYAGANYNGNVDDLSTLVLMDIPTSQAASLQSQVRAPNSALYVQTQGIPRQIVSQIDPSFPITSVSVDTAIAGGIVGTSATTPGNADAAAVSNSRRDAIIGVCAVFAGIMIAVTAWWAVRTYKRQQDLAHRRLTWNSADMHQAGGYGATAHQPGYQPAAQLGAYNDPNSPMNPSPVVGLPAAAAAAPPPAQDPFADNSSVEAERRRSFFYAEDSLRGYAVQREEEEGITFSQMLREQQGQLAPPRRLPINPSAISAPILRESSLNW